jgi:hypothetical protein
MENCAPKPETAVAPVASVAAVAVAAVAALASVRSEQRQREIVSQLANLSAEYASLLGPSPAPALADPPLMEEGGWIRISRANFEQVIFNQGGPVGAWVAAAAEEVAFDEYHEAELCRHEFERILRETGARVFSDAEWDHLMAIYPLHAYDTLHLLAHAPAALAATTQ